MAHIIRHKNIQNHLVLANAYRRMANIVQNRSSIKDEAAVVTSNSLRDLADEHQRRADVAVGGRTTFIFIK